MLFQGFVRHPDIARSDQSHLVPRAIENLVDRVENASRRTERGFERHMREGLLPVGMSADPGLAPCLTQALADAIHAYLARAPATLVAVQLEDILSAMQQANLPGTTASHPNWRRKLPLAIEALERDGRLRAVATAVARERASPPV